MVHRHQKVNLFFEVDASQYFGAQIHDMHRAVADLSDDQISRNEQLPNELLNEYQLEPLHFNFDGIYVSNREEEIPGEMHPKLGFLLDHMRGRSFPRQVITFHIPYSGNKELLRCTPNPRILSAPEVITNENEITFDIIDFYNDPERVKREADQILSTIKNQSQNLQNNVITYNTALPGQITQLIEQRKDQLQKQSTVVKSLGYPVKIPEPSAGKSQQIPVVTPIQTVTDWDIFISHASEDKDTFVRKLANELNKTVRVWYDEFTLRVGDSLRRSIDKGLARSRYGVVVLSHNFFKKEWPQKELDALAVMERNGRKIILPIWLDIDTHEILRYSPLLADRVAVKASEGLDQVVIKVLDALKT